MPAAQETEQGYKKDLQGRHIQMIAIGGAIGTGLFLGAGGRLAEAGPSLALVYLVCGIFAFFILRALGELVLYRPTSGSFVSYAREFIGEKGAFAVGWIYFLNWVLTGIVDATAIATYLQFWNLDTPHTQWIAALIALVVVMLLNFIGVKVFGEMEFWFSVIKVVALVAFLVIGMVVLGTRTEVAGQATGLQLITDHGGLFPNGVLAAVLLTQGVVFAYAAIELVGITAGETAHPEKEVPKAINSVVWRIAIFYVGSVLLLAMLLPWSSYSAGQSPFVTFFEKLGVPGADNIMNFVVITAALSSLNSGVYATGRTLRSLGLAGSAPKFTTTMNRNGVPVGAILLTVACSMSGVLLNFLFPSQAFNIVLNVASLAVIGIWTSIIVTHLLFRRAVARGEIPQGSFRLPGAPLTNYLTLGFLALVLVLTGLSGPVGAWTVALIPVIALALAAGWKATARSRAAATVDINN